MESSQPRRRSRKHHGIAVCVLFCILVAYCFKTFSTTGLYVASRIAIDESFGAAAPAVLPQILWLFWDSGVPELDIVKHCFDNWSVQNPYWEIRLLTVKTMSTWLSVDEIKGVAAAKTAQSKFDLVRISLLAKYGGVYADADVFGVLPLDTWLPRLVQPSGFFAFTLIGRDRPVASWFMASSPQNYISRTWRDAILAHVLFHGRFKQYLQLHYEFQTLLDKDLRFKNLWTQTPKINATINSKDSCCVPLLWNETLVPRVSVRSLEKHFYTDLNQKFVEMVNSRALPVIKGETKTIEAFSTNTFLDHLENMTWQSQLESSLARRRPVMAPRRSKPLVFNLGFPKTGTTSLTSFLNNAGLKCAHWEVCKADRCERVGPVMSKALNETKLLLSSPSLEDYDCLSQMDYCKWLNRSALKSVCYWPQFDMVETIHEQYPNASFVLTVRRPTEWLSSAARWGDLLERIRYSQSEGLRYGALDEEILQWFIQKHVKIRKFFNTESRRSQLFEIHQDTADSAATALLEHIFGKITEHQNALQFPQKNVNKNNS